jgi:hypothetical protein
MPSFPLNELGYDFETFTIGGRELKFSPLTIGERSKIQAVIRKVQPDPIKLAREAAEGQPEKVAAAIFEKAMKARAYWPSALDSPEGLQLIESSIEIQTAMIQGMVRPNHPELTEQEIKTIAESITPQAFASMAVYGLTGKRLDDPNSQTPNQASQPTGTN